MKGNGRSEGGGWRVEGERVDEVKRNHTPWIPKVNMRVDPK